MAKKRGIKLRQAPKKKLNLASKPNLNLNNDTIQRQVFSQPLTPLKKAIKKLQAFFTNSYTIIGIVTTLVGGFLLKDQILDYFLSTHEKYEKENFITGIFVPNAVSSDPDQTINIYSGSNAFKRTIKDLRAGTIIDLGVAIIIGNNPLHLKAILRNDSLFIETTLRDLKGEMIGQINYNKWYLFKPSIYNFHNNSKALEVLDKDGDVVFNMFYESNSLTIQGYFINDNVVYVCNDGFRTFDIKTDMDLIKSEIRRIKHLF